MSETTQNTPAEVLYQPEKELPAVASIADIDHFRIITKAGESSKATPAQVRELMGIDYSILTEQIVPGEYFVDTSGARRKVYVRTFAGTLATTQGLNRVSLVHGAAHVPIDIFGVVAVGTYDDQTTVPNKLIGVMNWGAFGISLEFDPSLLGKQYRVTVKYIKL